MQVPVPQVHCLDYGLAFDGRDFSRSVGGLLRRFSATVGDPSQQTRTQQQNQQRNSGDSDVGHFADTQWIKDMNARTAKNTPQSLITSITFGAADGVTDRPAGQTYPKTASAFAGKTAIRIPATTTKIESAVIPGAGVLGSVPLAEGSVWIVARPVSTR